MSGPGVYRRRDDGHCEPRRRGRRAPGVVLGLLLVAAGALGQEPPAGTAATPDIPPPLEVRRLSSPITLDGVLDEPAWQQAARIDTFYETSPADNTPPPVRTVAHLAYDDHALYIGIRAYDPSPAAIRAPYVERDNIIGTDDNVAVFLDTRNDRRSAIELRVNPRGNQADAVYNDANGNEDFSPDFFYDTAARIDAEGWAAELRIPLSSLRYSRDEAARWGILIWRNYPRDQRYFLHSSPIPRGSNCWICRARELEGITDLPPGGHLVVAPFATGRSTAQPRAGLGTPLAGGGAEADGGLDLKWTPAADNALDVTVNPDFSQVESDVGQIAVNNQFALFFPEKRPFFLEGVDLLDTPIQAVYTRTITDPRWGLRDTGKVGAAAFTLLVTEDAGGGSVIVPGPTGSGLALQDFSSRVLIGRLRRDLGASFGGLLLTARELEDGGHNRVLGPDFLWRPSGKDQVTGQVLVSDTATPVRPDLEPTWDGRTLRGHAAFGEWLHSGSTWIWRLTYEDVGDDFRADSGFVPRVGYKKQRFALVHDTYLEGFLRLVRAEGLVNYFTDRDGAVLARQTQPLVQLQGGHNLFAQVLYSWREQRRVGDELLTASYWSLHLQIDPGRRISRLVGSLDFGEQFDFANARVGRGGELSLSATVKPTDHLALDFNADRQWLDVGGEAGDGRLFTAQIARLKTTYNFNARTFVRLIGEHLDVTRAPALYGFPVERRNGSFSGSALFAYRLNWQTALFAGYGDERARDDLGTWQRASRAVFVKLSYAFQI